SGDVARAFAVRPHGAAHSALAGRGAVDPARCAIETNARPSSDLLERGRLRVHRLAYAAAFPVGASLARVARGRTSEFFRQWSDLLVARHSAVVSYVGMAPLDRAAVPVRGDVAVRWTVCLSRVLGTCGVPRVPVHAQALRRVRAPGPGMGRCLDVGVRYDRVRDSGGDRDDNAPLGSR